MAPVGKAIKIKSSSWRRCEKLSKGHLFCKKAVFNTVKACFGVVCCNRSKNAAGFIGYKVPRQLCWLWGGFLQSPGVLVLLYTAASFSCWSDWERW